MDKLKPCPFCGPNGTPIVRDCFDHFIAECGTCGCMQAAITEPSGTPRSDVIAAWNTRSTPPVQEAAKVLLECSLADLSIEMMRHHKRTKDSGHGGYMPSMRYALRAIVGEGNDAT